MAMIINFPGRKVVLVGTAHVSDNSVKEVFSVIEQENPDRVCIELDTGRYETLTNEWANCLHAIYRHQSLV